MTNIPTGDRGQRYEISCLGYPKDDETSVIGWAGSEEGARRMAEGILLAPGADTAFIKDRQTGKTTGITKRRT